MGVRCQASEDRSQMSENRNSLTDVICHLFSVLCPLSFPDTRNLKPVAAGQITDPS